MVTKPDRLARSTAELLAIEADLSMLERQREGIAKAKADGKYKGRPASIDAYEVKRVASLVGPAAAAKQLGIARSTVYRLLDQTPTSTTH
jgi:DNA invertase Pin-like site-specific DNA recombinase